MKKHYTYKKIQKVKSKIFNMLCENESDGLSLKEIIEKSKEEKELVITVLDELLNYNVCVVLKDEKYSIEV